MRTIAWICFVIAIAGFIGFIATVSDGDDPVIWLAITLGSFFNWAFLRVIANISVALQKQNDIMKAVLAKLNKKD